MCPEYFIPPDEDVWEGFHQQWIEQSWSWLKSIGLREDLMAKVRRSGAINSQPGFGSHPPSSPL